MREEADEPRKANDGADEPCLVNRDPSKGSRPPIVCNNCLYYNWWYADWCRLCNSLLLGDR